MNSLEEARKIINEVDQEMLKLFEKRMAASQMVAEFKRENNLPVFDAKREKELIDRNMSMLTSEGLSSYYKTFFEGVLKASKDYQKDLLK